jgi:PIN domain nuclease of toxin-antitoxin system
MKLLFDTHLLIWASQVAVGATGPLPDAAGALIDDEDNELWFSVASLWEIVIKAGTGRSDFGVQPHLLRRGLLDNKWVELPVGSTHVLAVGDLPKLHKDPFDRLLIAQATTEGVVLVTSDPVVAAYPGPIRRV